MRRAGTGGVSGKNVVGILLGTMVSAGTGVFLIAQTAMGRSDVDDEKRERPQGGVSRGSMWSEMDKEIKGKK
jgi:hypothetical protein